MKDMQWIQQRPIAHRGLWDQDIPENSLMAFRNAVKANFPIELDVQMTTDKQFVIFHDWTLQRMCGVDSCVTKERMKEISAYTLLSSQEYIPSLRDVLQMIDGRVPVLIEMKNRVHGRDLFMQELLNVLKTYNGIYALSSFDPFLVKKAKRLFPHILCGQNFSDYKEHGTLSGYVRKIVMYILWIVSWHKPDFFVCRASMLPRCWIAWMAHQRHVPLLTWAIGNKKEYERVRGVIDNTIFDHITRI